MKQDIYSIGEFSQLLGVTPDTLRYYEKRGVLSPKRDSENQYRYYSADDCPRMTAFRLFRACGFSFESTQASEACVNHPNFSKTIHSSVHDIQTEITFLKAKKKALLEYAAFSDKICSSGEFMEIIEMDTTLYFQKQLIDETPILGEGRTSIVKELTSLLPISFYGYFIPRSDFDAEYSSDSDGTDTIVYGIFMNEQYHTIFPELFQRWNPDLQIPLRAVCHFSIIENISPHTQNVERFHQISNDLTAQGYRVCGDGIAKIYPTPLNKSDWFIEVFLPIESIK